MKNKYAIAVCNLLGLHTEIYFLNGSSKLEALQHWATWYLHKDFASFDNLEKFKTFLSDDEDLITQVRRVA